MFRLPTISILLAVARLSMASEMQHNLLVQQSSANWALEIVRHWRWQRQSATLRDTGNGTLRGMVAANDSLSSSVCDGAERILQSIYQQYCDTDNPVTCVYGDTQKCSNKDLCSSDVNCGYVEDNPFVKFTSYECEVISIVPVHAKVTCQPALTPLSVGLIVAAVLSLVGCCFCVGFYCCRRRQRQIALLGPIRPGSQR